jgi:hypothetical protein
MPVSSVLRAKGAAPDVVVERFYNWYLSYPGNVLAEGAHRSSELLTEEFVDGVDTTVASFQQGGYDPILCAQDVPGEFTVDGAVVSGEKATVVVHQLWNVGTEHEFAREVVVKLQMVDGSWLISDIICQ